MKASKSWKLPFTAIFHYLKVAMYSCFLPLIEITRYSSRRCMEVKAAKAFFTNKATACHRYLFLGCWLFEMCTNYLVVSTCTIVHCGCQSCTVVIYLEVCCHSCSILEETGEATSGLHDSWFIATLHNLSEKEVTQ